MFLLRKILSNCRLVQSEICVNEEIDIYGKDKEEDVIDNMASNPIYQFKLVKGMYTFARYVYPVFLYSFLDTGSL